MILTFQHKETGLIKQAPIGFSWTTLFFGFFPALMRGDMKWGVIMLLVNFLSGGISNLIFPFFYNQVYIKDLFEQGYVLLSPEGKEALNKYGIKVITIHYEEDRAWE